MLTEYKQLPQDKKGYRRLFSDKECDLYLWYDNKESFTLIGFQIIYKSNTELKALTWTQKDGFIHLGVDEGRNCRAQTPILVSDGVFEYENVKQTVVDNIELIEDKDVKYSLEKIRQYGEMIKI